MPVDTHKTDALNRCCLTLLSGMSNQEPALAPKSTQPQPTWHCAEVVDEGAALAAEGAEIGGAPAPLQQQQAVKGLEDLNAGLVDGHCARGRVEYTSKPDAGKAAPL
jgi:hypothetical protein